MNIIYPSSLIFCIYFENSGSVNTRAVNFQLKLRVVAKETLE